MTVPLTFTEAPGRQGRSFSFQIRALEPVVLPPAVVPRLLITTVAGFDEPTRIKARYWVESHGPVFPFVLPEGARWIAARIDGRMADQLDFDASRQNFRLRFPHDTGTKPAVIELEYQMNRVGAGSTWDAPRLLDGAAVLHTVWDVRVPWSTALIGVPQGWCDENQWYWDGYLWIRRPGRDGASLEQWLLGSSAPQTAIENLQLANLDNSQRYLFSRLGEPLTLRIWIASRTGIVAACSGITLLLGYFAIFSRARFRTVWAVLAGIALLAAMFSQPSVTLLALQSAVMGLALTLLGLVMQRMIERSKARTHPGAAAGAAVVLTTTDSGMVRSAAVGSDDSTAIRVRVPSTADFAAMQPAHQEPRLAGDSIGISSGELAAVPASASPVQDEPRSSTLKPA
jgi:hypothetical protein